MFQDVDTMRMFQVRWSIAHPEYGHFALKEMERMLATFPRVDIIWTRTCRIETPYMQLVVLVDTFNA